MKDSRFERGQPARVGIVTGQLAHGGAERQLFLLAKALRQSGEFVPVVFCLSDAIEPYGHSLTEAGIEWYAVRKGTPVRLEKLFWLANNLRLSGCSLVYGILNIGNIYGVLRPW